MSNHENIIGTDIPKTITEAYPNDAGGFDMVEVHETVKVERATAPSGSGWFTASGIITASTNPKRVGTKASVMVKVSA